MLFSSMTFVFLFLPIVCLTYFLVKNEFRNSILLIASIIFYAWGEPRYLAIMILVILINYVGALALGRYDRCKKLILLLSIVLNLSFLFYFKYFNFFVDNINTLFDSNFEFIKVIMPIGISFYTFQAMSYLIDVSRGAAVVQRDIYKLALYITLFPQLVAGPIVKYKDVEDQIDHRSVTFDKVVLGVKRFIIGLAKKMLIANTMGAVADKIFELPVIEFDAAMAWVGAVCYSLQLFYDFSGYSDMAIGLGLIFGFHFLENFNYPYISKSITEFWRRWHISLSTWFKEYLYIPLGGNRISPVRTYLNLFVVFLATGFWHGASWTFIMWGLWHGFFIIFERMTGWNREKKSKILTFFQRFYTILAFTIGWVLFRAETLSYAVDYVKNMFGFFQSIPVYRVSDMVDNLEYLVFAFAVACAMPIFNRIFKIPYEKKVVRALVNVWLIILFGLSAITISASTYNPFIYFRF